MYYKKSKLMANNLPFEKKVTAISMLAEGSSIRSVERMTAALAEITSRFGLELGDSTPLAILNHDRHPQRGAGDRTRADLAPGSRGAAARTETRRARYQRRPALGASVNFVPKR